MNFNWGNPQMLWLLLLVMPPLVFFLAWAWRRRQYLMTQFISARLLPGLKVGVSPSRQKAKLALFAGSIACLILALARPQWGYVQEEARQRGLDIIVAIDTSNSMLAEDAPPNRLTRAKLAAMDLMKRAKSDRLGLVAFAGDAYMQCPLTLDDAAFSQSVDGLDTKTISQGGTALAEAIETANTAFKEEKENHKVLVIFTDGEDHEGEAVAAAEKAYKDGMRIFTIGIGSPDGEQLRIRDERGRVDYIRDEQGNPVKSQLNEKLLQQVAQSAGGFYLPLRGTKTMDTLYEQGLAPLPKSTNSSKFLQRYIERFHWPLAVGIVLLLVEMFLPDSKRRRVKPPVTQPAAAVSQALILALLLNPGASQAAGPGRALKEYEAGKYEDALKDYQKLLESKKDDPRLHFNAGTAAYQSRKLDEAAKQFGETLNAPDLKLQQRAYYNLGNTLFRMGEQAANAPMTMPTQGASPEGDPRMKIWEQAIQNFDSALKLDPQDADAKFNRSFVQRQLEELKKQQQQQQQQNKDNKDNKDDQKKQDQQDQQNQQNKDDKKDQDKKQQDQQQQDQKDQQQQQQQQQQSDKKDDKESQSQAQKEQEKKDQEKKQQAAQKKASEQKEKSKEEQEKEAAMMAAGQMTPDQAKQLLDSQKGEDEVLKMPQPNKPANRNRSTKNW